MDFPITLNKLEFTHIVRCIQEATVRETVPAVLIELGHMKPYLTRTECENRSTPAKISTAIRKGELSFVAKGRNRMIKRSQFENWLTKDSLL